MNTVEQGVSNPLLIAETNPHLLQALPSVLRERMPHLHFDVCASQDHVMHNLVSFPYNTVISNVHLAGSVDSFLKRNQALPSFVPLVITAGASDEQPARQALEQGAFDLITDPLDPDQTVTTVRVALWQNRLLRMIDSRNKAIEKYLQHIAAYPDDTSSTARFLRALNAVKRSFSVSEQTVDVLLNYDFPTIATSIERETRAKALDRLRSLCREGGKDIAAIPQPTTTLLFVDELQDLDIWSKALRESSANYSILTATSVHAALNICRSQRIDCVLLDLDLPDSSGFELLLKLIPDRKRPKIAVVVLTHLTNPHLHEMSLQNGAQACLMKNCSSAQDLCNAIHKAIASIATSDADSPPHSQYRDVGANLVPNHPDTP